MPSKDLLKGSTHNRSSHMKDEFVSVTVRKNDPSDKAGIRLETDDKGRVKVMNIATNGLFADSEIEIGDIILSINGKRLARGEGPEALVDVISNAACKVTVVAKKTSMKPRVAEAVPKDSSKVQDNNIKQTDHFYSGQSRHNEDGSLAFLTKKDMMEEKITKKVVKSVTIAAQKEDQDADEIDETAGITFVLQKKKLFINSISEDSIFFKTDLSEGDRVLSVNDCNFRAYADAKYASRIVRKATNIVTLIVEKGVEGFQKTEVAVDDSDLNSTGSRPRRNRSRSGERKARGRPRLSGTSSASELASDLDSTDSVSSATFQDDEFTFEEALPLKRSQYKEMVISAPKEFSTQEVGLKFDQPKNKYLAVRTIQEGSIFENTSLEVGDIILEINGDDYRFNPDRNRAWKSCFNGKETVTFLVLKRAEGYKKEEFNLDGSVSNLNWQ